MATQTFVEPENVEAIKRQTRILLLDDLDRLKDLMTQDELDQVEEEVDEIDKNKSLTDFEKIQQYLDKIDDLKKKERFILKDRVERVKVVEKGKEYEEKLRQIMYQLERYTADELETLRAAERKEKPEEFIVEVKEETPENFSKGIDQYLEKMDDVNLRIRDALDDLPQEQVKNNAPPRTPTDPVHMDNFLRLRDLSDDLVYTNQLIDPETKTTKFDMKPNPDDPEDVQEITKKVMDKLEDDHDSIRAKINQLKKQLELAEEGKGKIDPESVKEIMERCKNLIRLERETLYMLREDEVYEEFVLEVESSEQHEYIEGTHLCLEKLEEYDDEMKELAKRAQERIEEGREAMQRLKDLEIALADQVHKEEKMVELLGGVKEPEEDEQPLDEKSPAYGKKLVRRLAKKQNELDRLIRKKKKEYEATQRLLEETTISMEDLYKRQRVTLDKQISIFEFISRTTVTDKMIHEEISEYTLEEYMVSCVKLTERVDHYSKKIDRQIKSDEDLIYEDLSTVFHTLRKISTFISNLTFQKTEDEVFSQEFSKTISRKMGTVESLEINKQYCLFIKNKFEAFKKLIKLWISSFEKQIEFTVEIEDKIDDCILSKSHAFEMSKFKSFESGDTFEAKLRNNQLRLQKIHAFIKKVEAEGFGAGSGGGDPEYLKSLYYKIHTFSTLFQEFIVEVTDEDLDHVREYPDDVTEVDMNLVQNYLTEMADSNQTILDENGEYVISRFDKILEAKNKAENQYQTLRVFMDDQEEELNRKTQEVGRLLIKCSMLISRIQTQDQLMKK